jgi:hypothetical protein
MIPLPTGPYAFCRLLRSAFAAIFSARARRSRA